MDYTQSINNEKSKKTMEKSPLIGMQSNNLPVTTSSSFNQDENSQISVAAAACAAQIMSQIHQSNSNSPQPNKYLDQMSQNDFFQAATAAAAAAINNNINNSNKSSVSASPKAICSICGDKASGKHYGVHSCEGCKGFFKRTVRKDLTYTCRDTGQCIVDKRQRNRCQYCRYHKCLFNGMKREAVQEERHKYKFNQSMSPLSNNELKEEIKDFQIIDQLNDDLVLTTEEMDFLKKINDVEDKFNPDIRNSEPNSCSIEKLYESLENQLKNIPNWAKSIDKFTELEIDDQVSLLRANWREILCCSVAHRSIPYDETLHLANGYIFTIDSCKDESLKYLINRLSEDIINIMRNLEIDRVELALLKLIMLFDTDAKNIKDNIKINEMRDSICATLEKYSRRDQFINDPSRFAKLLLRLPSLRSWVLRGTENIMAIKAANNFDNILVEAFVKNQ